MIQITAFGLKPLILQLDNAERVIMTNMEDAMERSVKHFQETVRANSASFRFQGDFWESIATETTTRARSIEGRVYSTDDPGKVLAIELGRSPGATAPPIMPLLKWVQTKWGGDMQDAFWLQRAIASRGSHTSRDPSGQKPFERAFTSELPKVLNYWDAMELFQDVLT